MATDQDLTDMSLHERAAHLLITRSALEELSLEDAAKVVGYMELRAIEAGTVSAAPSAGGTGLTPALWARAMTTGITMESRSDRLSDYGRMPLRPA